MDTNIGQKVTAFDQNNRNLLSRHAKKKRNQKDKGKENLEVIFDLRSNLFTLLSMNIYVFTYVYNMIIGKSVWLWANSDR